VSAHQRVDIEASSITNDLLLDLVNVKGDDNLKAIPFMEKKYWNSGVIVVQLYYCPSTVLSFWISIQCLQIPLK